MNQRLALTILVSSVLVAMMALLLFFGSSSSRAALAAAPRAPAPIVTLVSPSSAPNNLDTVIMITGANFAATPVVRLGSTPLQGVSLVDSTMLTATVPWGLTPGVFALSVVNPDAQSASLPNAFTVTQGVGVWTTGGPYGGWANDIAVSPTVSRTAFAVVGGLWRTQDAGDHWTSVFYDADGRGGVTFGPGPTNTLYYWSSKGLWKSNDEGVSFQQVLTNSIAGFAVDSHNGQSLWVGIGNKSVRHSTDGGDHFSPQVSNLPLNSTADYFAINPLDSNIVYAVFRNGSVYKYDGHSSTWSFAGTGLPSVSVMGYKLAINPFAPNILQYGHFLGPYTGYRTTDGGVQWSQITMSSSSILADVAFSPYISGTVYATLGAGTVYGFVGMSTDGGENWSAVGTPYVGPTGGKVSLALDPALGVPAYVGTQTKIWRSPDGGLTWEKAYNGILGLIPHNLAAIPGRPENVFADVGDGFMSNNAGNNWRDIPLPSIPSCIGPIGISPAQPNWVYIIPACGNKVFRSSDGGTTWEMPGLGPWSSSGLETIAVAPASSAVIYLGGRDAPAWLAGQSVGAAYRSADNGSSWTPITFTVPISSVGGIAVDPTNSQRVYLSAGARASISTVHPGKGIFRSENGGDTWTRISQDIGNVSVFGMAIHPAEPQTIYASGWLSSEAKLTVFKSMDGGDHWITTTMKASGDYGSAHALPPIVIDPLDHNAIYAGTPDGLYRSLDGGINWNKPFASFDGIKVVSLAMAADEKRTILYVGTPGGLPTGISPMRTKKAQSVSVGGGVYQLTIDHQTVFLYLPAISR